MMESSTLAHGKTINKDKEKSQEKDSSYTPTNTSSKDSSVKEKKMAKESYIHLTLLHKVFTLDNL